MGGQLTHLSLFSGIGGLDLAAEWAGIETVGQCEWAEYPTKVLEKHWPDVPRWKDIRTLTGESFYERTGRRTVDIISGGFPCQPFSVAGKQRGKEDDRYLWPEMVRVIKELRPTWVVGENVAGIVRMALPDILSELETCGYRTRTFFIPACAIGARHRRYRVAIVGYSEHNGSSSTEITGGSQKTGRGQQEGKKAAGKFTGTGKSGNSKDLADSHTERELQSTGSEQDIRNGVGISRKTLADAESQFEGRLPVRKEPKKPRTISSCEDVQHANGAGRKEQYISQKPDKEGFTGWRCDAGNVCNATGERLPDRASEPLGGQRTQEQESERPMRRTVESVLGGVASRIPDRMDGGIDNNEHKEGSIENMSNLWKKNESETVRGETRRYGSIREKSVLQQRMYGDGIYENKSRRISVAQESKEIFKESMRDVWYDKKFASSSLRYESIQQCERKYNDTMRFLPYEIPLDAWKDIDKEVSCLTESDALDFIINHYWDEEPGIPRIATGIEHRVDRLKCLGNAVVPQQFYPIFKAIAEVEKP